MVVGLVLDLHGWPLCCELWPGNTADVTSLLPVETGCGNGFGSDGSASWPTAA